MRSVRVRYYEGFWLVDEGTGTETLPVVPGALEDAIRARIDQAGDTDPETAPEG